MFTSKTTQSLVYSLRLKPMLVAMKSGEMIDIPTMKTNRMNVWTATSRLNKAAGWKEYVPERITDERGRTYFRIRRRTLQEAQAEGTDTVNCEAVHGEQTTGNALDETAKNEHSTSCALDEIAQNVPSVRITLDESALTPCTTIGADD